ncbi:MAG TPA: peptide chain release factor N(5)-glutamine methyltransferase [Ruminococcaceae bacterium]|nr:peptide chain release factor N(5)-glutamine methyltransferase [Oscillospiraceae bacterium]
MTNCELYKKVVSILESSDCHSPSFDAGCLFFHITGIQRGMLPFEGSKTAPPEMCSKLLDSARQRAEGRPLQYILGTWDFLSLTLEVGEGVLIPRADTELLCETAADRLSGIDRPKVLDLCAGSGCVGLGLASLCPDADVTAVELSDEALYYLERNCARYPKLHVTPVKANVLLDADGFQECYDAILSNPPYIPADEIPSLMQEVQHEPVMALDGGDGLVFYRAIIRSWLPKLVSGGICAVEVGMGQAKDVAAMFSKAGLINIEMFRDLGGIERVVIGETVNQ